MDVCFQIHTTHINLICRLNVEVLYVKLAAYIVITVRYLQ